MKNRVILKKGSNFYNSMDSIISYVHKTSKAQLPQIFRFENPSYGFNVGKETFLTPDINSVEDAKFVISEEIIAGFLETYKIVFVGVVGNKQDLYKNQGIYQSNVMITNMSVFTIMEDGSFIDLIRKLKFNTSHPDMIFYPLVSYVDTDIENLYYCVLNDELVTIETFDEAISNLNTFAYTLVDPTVGSLKDELFEMSCITEGVKIAKNAILLPNGINEVTFKIAKDFFYEDILFDKLTKIVEVSGNCISKISGNSLTINVTDKFSIVNINIKLHEMFDYGLRAEKMNYDFLIVWN